MLLAVGNGREGSSCCGARCSRVSLACHREHGTQTFAVDDIGLANLACRVPEPASAAPRRRNAASNHLALALTI